MKPAGTYQPPKLRLKAYQRDAVAKLRQSNFQLIQRSERAAQLATAERLRGDALLKAVREQEKKFLSRYPFYRPSGNPETLTASVTVERSQRPDLDFIEMVFRISRTVWRDETELCKELLLRDAINQVAKKLL